MKISINMTDGRHKLDKRIMIALIRKVLIAESVSDMDVDIIYCRDREIIPLNTKFKGKRNTTDVLAFNLEDSSAPDYLGEVYVNLEQARRQAVEFEVPYMEEVRRLTLHGVLHLLGFRDDTNENRLKMWSRQESYLNGKG
jgi:probable rRNA maturation factor